LPKLNKTLPKKFYPNFTQFIQIQIALNFAHNCLKKLLEDVAASPAPTPLHTQLCCQQTILVTYKEKETKEHCAEQNASQHVWSYGMVVHAITYFIPFLSHKNWGWLYSMLN